MEQSDLIYRGPEISDPGILNRLPKGYRRILTQTNGFILFDGGLHIRGAVLTPEWHSLREAWQGDFALHRLFTAVEQSDIPFAQDCLGDQFLLRGGIIHKLEAETGEIQSLNMGLEDFMEAALENPVEFLSLEPFLMFRREGGELSPGQLLSVYPPFIAAGSANGVSFRGGLNV